MKLMTVVREVEMRADSDQDNAYRIFFDMCHDLMLLVDDQGRIRKVNKRWCERIGGLADLYLGQDWLGWVAAQDRSRADANLRGDDRQVPREGLDLRLLKQDGKELWVKWDVCADDNTGGLFFVFKDISLQKRFEEELHRIELKDELSGAFNRRYFLNRSFEELLRSVRYESGFCMMVIDIDRLTEVNERFDQFSGDQAIRKVAQICMKTLRSTDLFGRMGGGEFACLLIETTLPGAEIIAERICHAIADHELELSACSLPVTVTIGLCSRKDSDVSIEDILKRTQNALRRGKAAGGNRVQTEDQ